VISKMTDKEYYMDITFNIKVEPRLRRKIDVNGVYKQYKDEMANLLKVQVLEGLKEMSLETFIDRCCEFHFFYEYKDVDNLAFYPKRVYI